MSSVFIIKDVENYKMLSWLESYMVGINGFIAGGCFKNILRGDKAKDLDMFFPDRAEFLKAESAFSKDSRFVETYRTSKSVGFKDKEGDIKIDLVSSIYGTPEEVLEKFDFTITQFAYFFTKEPLEDEDNPFSKKEYETVYHVIHHKDFFEHLMMNRLVIDKPFADITFPVSTFDRMLRYAKYGFAPCRETKSKLVSAIQVTEVQSGDDISRSLYDGVD